MIFCHFFLMSRQLTKEVGWLEDLQWSGVVGGKKCQLGHHWSSHDANRHPPNGHATLVGHRATQSAVGAILDLQYLISTLHQCYCSSHDFGVLAKCPPEKETRFI